MSDDLIKPNHNKVGGKDAWDTMVEIAKGNDAFDKSDIVFMTLMFKHIPRAGRKSYGGKNALVDKVTDLRKAKEYLSAWIDHIEGEIIKEEPVVLSEEEERVARIQKTIEDAAFKPMRRSLKI